ncbi:MAG TPA: zinc ribbon domain-containing protein [Solirubrobacterales bacterium]|nr:zinc ribbon domain-containing protein [Solirubrobacterales bacterium]
MLTALFGISDGSLNLAVNLLILVLVVIWISLIWWTYADARRRIDDSVLVTTATAASLFPFIGTIVYTILRPPEFIEDARERELETKAAELRLRRLAETSCPRCEHPVELSWLRCPECQHHLKDPCRSCGRPVDPRWSICPHCETAVSGGSGSGQARQQRKRPARSSQQRQRPAAKRPAQSSEARTAQTKQAESGKRRAPSSEGRSDGSRRSEQPSGSGSDPERRPRRKPTKRT